MRKFQPSFAGGEISPILHARTDISKHQTSLAKLDNFIVLPQGGAARRPGLRLVTRTKTGRYSRLVPFVYAADDCVMLEFYDRGVRVLTKDGEELADYPAPYRYYSDTRNELKELRYAQNGNIMVVTHINHKPHMLTRKKMNEWEFKEIEFSGGPWIEGGDAGPDSASLTIVDMSDVVPNEDLVRILSSAAGTFGSGIAGTMIAVDCQMQSRTLTENVSNNKADDPWVSPAFEVGAGAKFEVSTSGTWRGVIDVERSIDGGASWLSVQHWDRTGYNDNIAGSFPNTDEDVLYRVKAYKTMNNNIPLSIFVEGWIKKYTFRVLERRSDKEVIAARVYREHEVRGLPGEGDTFFAWQIGAWGGGVTEGTGQGYPRACCFYQDRLVLASSHREPNTVWLSRVGDYLTFGSPAGTVNDDDPITLTMTAGTAEGIHSLVAMKDILAFTNSGEWRISGSGENGAISPTAVTAHQQSSVGSKAIQPLLTHDGRVVFVQTHGTKVYAIGYDFSSDGYSSNELSILSGHIFEWNEGGYAARREIEDFGWQRVPDGLLWFVLKDGSMAVCTFNVEHEVVGWARAGIGGRAAGLANIPGDRETEQWAVVYRGGAYQIERFARRVDEDCFTDCGSPYVSRLRTLRLTADSEQGTAYPSKKLSARLVLHLIRCGGGLYAAPVTRAMSGRENARRRRVISEYSHELTDAEVQLDAGFAADAAVELTVTNGACTIAAVSPLVTFGG